MVLKRNFVYIAVFIAMIPAATAAFSQAPGEGYATSLGVLYNERNRLSAFKDVCSRVLPKLRRDTQAAYEDWTERQEDVLDDLEARFLAMVKQASRNPQEYARNYGKYYGAVVEQRQAQKDAFLALPKEELLKECRKFPAYLRGRDSDLPNRYPEEFNAIYAKSKK